MDKLAIYDQAQRLITYYVNGNEINEISENGGTVITFTDYFKVLCSADGAFLYIYARQPTRYLLKVDAVSNAVIWYIEIATLPGGPFNFGDMIFGTDGNLYLLFYVPGQVYIIDINGVLLDNWGVSGALPGQFDDAKITGSPRIRTDSLGNVYVLEIGKRPGCYPDQATANRYLQSRIQKFQVDGTYIASFGQNTHVTQYSPFFVWDVPATEYDGEFSSPQINFQIDGFDNIYVFDSFTSYLQKFDSSGNFLSKTLLTGGRFDCFYRTTAYGMLIDLIINNAGNLLFPVCPFDSSCSFVNFIMLEERDLAGNYIATHNIWNQTGGCQSVAQDTFNNYYVSLYPWGHAYLLKQLDSTYAEIFNFPVSCFVQLFVPSPFDFSTIQSVAYFNNKIYVVDVIGNKIYVFDIDLNYLFTFGSPGAGNGQFSFPNSITTDYKNSRLIVCDNGNARIQAFDENGNYLSKRVITEGTFNLPMFTGVDQITGDIYVTLWAEDFVYKYDELYNFILSFGGSGAGHGQFDRPLGLDVDNNNNVYVVDSNNARVEKYSPIGNYILTLSDVVPNFNGIEDLSYGKNKIYVADRNNFRIKIFDKAGNYINFIAAGTFGVNWGELAVAPYVEFIDCGNYKRLVNYPRDKTLIGR